MCFIYNECFVNEYVINLGIVVFECWFFIFLSEYLFFYVFFININILGFYE